VEKKEENDAVDMEKEKEKERPKKKARFAEVTLPSQIQTQTQTQTQAQTQASLTPSQPSVSSTLIPDNSGNDGGGKEVVIVNETVEFEPPTESRRPFFPWSNLDGSPNAGMSLLLSSSSLSFSSFSSFSSLPLLTSSLPFSCIFPFS